MFSCNLFSTYIQKCLIVISDYCEFDCWNSCSRFSVMFVYMNLMIIELLMLNLHAQVIWKWVLCDLCSNWWIMILCCWIVVEFMIMSCGCYYMLLLISFHGLGIDKLSCCCWLSCFGRIGFVVVKDLVFLRKSFSINFISCSSVVKWVYSMC